MTIEFDASSSTGGNLTYVWDFGDGQKATGVKVTHTYNFAGNYFPVLKVSSTAEVLYTSQHVLVAVPDPGKRPDFSRDNPASVVNTMVWYTKKSLAEKGLTKLLDFVSDPKEIGGIESFTPDRMWVLYQTNLFDEDGSPSTISSFNYKFVNLETGIAKSFSSPQNVNAVIEFPTLSSDASKIAFTVFPNRDIIMDVETLHAELLVPLAEVFESYWRLSFSPDGEHLTFIAMTPDVCAFCKDENCYQPLAKLIAVSTSYGQVSITDNTHSEDIGWWIPPGIRWEGDTPYLIRPEDLKN